MKTLTNTQEFVRIYSQDRQFIEAMNAGELANIKMRFFISSYNFKAPRSLADEIISIASGLCAA
jgi:hypothetical protein